MHLLTYIAAQIWPNLAASVLWVPLAYAGARLHARHLGRHLADHIETLITHHGADHDDPAAP